MQDSFITKVEVKKPTVSNPVEAVVSWDLDRITKAVNSPCVRVPDNIKDYDGFSKWVNSLTDKDFKSK